MLLKKNMRYYCTYFDKGYLVRAIALHASLLKHESHAFTLYAVCLDELTRILLERLQLPGVVAIPLHEIENGDNALRKARSNRDLVEYYWTLTPTVILRLLERYNGIDAITYLDADLFFFSSADPIYEEFQGHSVLIHEHRFQESFKSAIEFGRFNVGLLCFRRDCHAMEVLKWWRDQCNAWCYARLEYGKYGDQMYLDSWPERFKGVCILQHIGAGVAPWNNMQYRYSTNENGAVMVNDVPLVFYHFHALFFSHPRYVVFSRLTAHRFKLSLISFCYLPYIKQLHAAFERLWNIYPGFDFGLTGMFCHTLAAIIFNADDMVLNLPNGVAALDLVRLDDNYSLLRTEQVAKDE